MNISQGSRTVTWCDKGHLTVPFTVADSEDTIIKNIEIWGIKKLHSYIVTAIVQLC
jgi:hypothetical protein